MSTLDLRNANLKGFDALPSGTYDATVFEVNDVETENQDGKLPVGTPGINIQFKVNGGEYDNRRVFTRYWFAPADYDPSKKSQMDGMIARFLLAVGFTEEAITSGKFKLVNDELLGRDCRVTVQKYVYDGIERNRVTAVRPAGQNAEDAGIL